MANTSRTARRLAFSLLFCALAAGAAEPPAIESAWPFFYWRHDAARTELDLLGPLGFYERTPQATRYGLRPFFDAAREAEGQKRSLHVLYPLATFRSDAQSTWRFVFPFYFHTSWVAANGKPVDATVVFPFFWWGTSPTEGPWFAILFVGGTFKGILGADRVDYSGFTYTKIRTGQYVTEHIISPFGTRWRGPDKSGWRIWPFYCTVEWKGHWRNGYVMWPFYCYGSREAGETRDAADYVASWPFFGRSWGRDGKSGSLQLLWPLFYHGWNEHSGFSQWQCPWPFFTTRSGKDLKSFDLWPFYGRSRAGARTETRLLGGIVRLGHLDTKTASLRETRVYPLFTHLATEDKRRESRRSFWELWPFFRARSRQEGETKWADANSLQLGWMSDPEASDRTFNALLGLYEHQRTRDGESGTRLLWRLFRVERGPGWRYTQLGPLASWQTAPNLTRASFLLGLFQTGQCDGRRGWRLFYVPFGARLSRPPAEETTDGR